MMLLLMVLLLLVVGVLAVREVRRDGLGERRPPRGPEEWCAGHLPSHPYAV